MTAGIGSDSSPHPHLSSELQCKLFLSLVLIYLPTDRNNTQGKILILVTMEIFYINATEVWACVSK